MVESQQPQEPSDLFMVPMKVWPFSLPTLSGKTSRFSMPKLKIFLVLAISFVMLTTAFGHNSSVSCYIVFNSLNTHVTWSVASHPRVPDAARRESSSGVKKTTPLWQAFLRCYSVPQNVPTSFKISSPEYAEPKKDITCEKPYWTNIYRELRIKNLLPLGFLTCKNV